MEFIKYVEIKYMATIAPRLGRKMEIIVLSFLY